MCHFRLESFQTKANLFTENDEVVGFSNLLKQRVLLQNCIVTNFGDISKFSKFYREYDSKLKHNFTLGKVQILFTCKIKNAAKRDSAGAVCNTGMGMFFFNVFYFGGICRI